MAAIAFPGEILSEGTSNADAVKAVQQQLGSLGVAALEVTGVYGDETEKAVRAFQLTHLDGDGQALEPDGKVGPKTWAALFQAGPGGTAAGTTASDSTNAGTVVSAPTALLAAVVQAAANEVGVMEVPLGSNRGPRVDQYIRSAGLDPAANGAAGFPWCASFVYFCFQQAASQLGVANPAARTAGALDTWNSARSTAVKITAAQAMADPTLVVPGAIFVLDEGRGLGHVGIVKAVNGMTLDTIEGNTNAGGSREGIGVFERNVRTIDNANPAHFVNRGYVIYR